ncbi:MAG: hypothetical protein Q7R93_00455 [bacterium]|nr:hypothetical protein [bacterium]
MKEFAESGVERGGAEPAQPVHSREEGLLRHEEKPANAWEHQIVLAADLYVRNHPAVVVKVFDHKLKEEIMQYWTRSGYGAVFRDLLKNPGFKEHPRFKNDPLQITLEDLDYFVRVQQKELPQ